MRTLIKYQLAGLLLLPLINQSCPNVKAAATEPYGLDGMSQFERLPYLKLDTMAGGQSSFDRTGGNGDFSNFLYSQGGDKVLLDLTGPGTVYRIWFTGFNQATDYIKVYFDSETTPRINMLLANKLAGTNAPFLFPLCGNDVVSSGGFYCYLPLPFQHSIKITSNATAGSFYYNIGYHLYSPDTSVSTWTGAEDSSAVRNLWSNAGVDPKSDAGNVTVSKSFDLPAGATHTLLDIAGARSISAIKLRIPGTEPQPQPPSVTDDGRAHKGYSQFQMAVDPANNGVVLVRRLDYGVGNQKAHVFVDGTNVGQWFDAGSDGSYHWRDSSFNIPATYTTNKSSIHVQVVFVSSDNDWNEFRYWAYSWVNGTTNLTDTLDVGNAASESSHGYVINTQTWTGIRTFEYPPSLPAPNTADLLSNMWISISFDSETKPSVFAPIGSSLLRDGTVCFLLHARIAGGDGCRCEHVLLLSHAICAPCEDSINQPAQQCHHKYRMFDWRQVQTVYGFSFANVGYFKTAFNSELPTTNGSDIIMLDAEGSGHLVGVVENMMGPTSRSYLEGDERFYVDDSLSPAFYGTGTEDFYNGGWYFDHGAVHFALARQPGACGGQQL